MAKLGDNKGKMVNFRVTEEDFELIKVCAIVTGQTKASGEPNIGEYIRFMLRMSLVPMKTELHKRGVSAHEAYQEVRFGDGLLQYGGVPYRRNK